MTGRPVVALSAPLLLALVLAGPAAGAEPAVTADPSLWGDYIEAPVYYEMFRTRYTGDDDLSDLRAGRVRVQHYEPVDVSSFDWSQDSFTDYTWWMQMQEMRFILPLVASTRDSDRRLARDWLERWFDKHMSGDLSQRLWGEPMTWAYRAMVFVYFFKTEMQRAEPDGDVLGMLSGSILEHQMFLEDDKHFDAGSNHGLIDALGLFETTRVFGDPAVRQLACDRIERMCRSAVSERGVELEHSAAYHFVFLRWLDEIRLYMESIPTAPAGTVGVLEDTTRRMQGAAYYLQDQRGWIPQIGDGDSVRVDWYGESYRRRNAPGAGNTLFDPESGYAVLREDSRRTPRRYVVLRQPFRLQMPYHVHHDVLAVFFGMDGEVILGDAGKFGYGRTPEREYFVSAEAHNTIAGALQWGGRFEASTLRVASMAGDLSRDGDTEWFAQVNFGPFVAKRTVRIPRHGTLLAVVDTVRVSQQSAVTAAVLWNIGRDVTRVVPERQGDDGAWSWGLTTRGNQRLRLTIAAAPSSIESVEVVHGRTRPQLGWYSPRHGVMRPNTVIVARLRSNADVSVETRVELSRKFRRR